MKNNIKVDHNSNSRIDEYAVSLLKKEFGQDITMKDEIKKIIEKRRLRQAPKISLFELHQNINEWHTDAQQGLVFPIKPDSVKRALWIVKRFIPTDTDSALLYLASLNLLNAATKISEFNPLLTIENIKEYATSFIPKLDNIRKCDVAFFYEVETSCLYFSVGGLIVFSFIEVPVSIELLKAKNQPQIKWTGIRLQKIAQPIFNSVSKEFNMEDDIIENSIFEKEDNDEKTLDINIKDLITESYAGLETFPGDFRNFKELIEKIKNVLDHTHPTCKMTELKIRETIQKIPGVVIKDDYVNILTGKTHEVIKFVVPKDYPELNENQKSQIKKIVTKAISLNKGIQRSGGWYDYVSLASDLREAGLKKEDYGFDKLTPLITLAYGDLFCRQDIGSKTLVRFDGHNKHNASETKNTIQNSYPILEDCNIGDLVEISIFGITKEGRIASFKNDFLELELADSKWVRIKYGSIASVEKLARLKVEIDVSQIETQLLEILDSTDFDLSKILITNAVITMFDSKRIWMTTDSGETNTCYKSAIIGYDKEKIIKGQRVFVFPSKIERTYAVVLETDGKALLDYFLHLLETYNEKITSREHKRTMMLWSLSYLMLNLEKNSDAYRELKHLKVSLKRDLGGSSNAFGDDQIEQSLKLAQKSHLQEFPKEEMFSPSAEDRLPEEIQYPVSEFNIVDDTKSTEIFPDGGQEGPQEQSENKKNKEKPELKIIGKIDLSQFNTKNTSNLNSSASKKPVPSYYISLDDINEDIEDYIPADGVIISLGNKFGFIRPFDGSVQELYMSLMEVVEHPGIIDTPKIGDKVLYTPGKNKQGPIATCVIKQCSVDVLEELAEKYSSFDPKKAKLMEKRITTLPASGKQGNPFKDLVKTLSRYLDQLGLNKSKISPDEVEIIMAEKLTPEDYQTAMQAMVKIVVATQPSKSYNLFLRTTSYARSHGFDDWAIELLELAMKTFATEDGKQRYFRTLLKSIKQLKNRIVINDESLSQAISESENIFGPIPQYVKVALLSYKEFSGVTLDKDTSRSSKYKVEYIDEVKASLENNKTNDLMYLTLIKLQLSFNADSYNPADDIRKFLFSRGENIISNYSKERFSEARYLIRLGLKDRNLEKGMDDCVSLYLMTLGEYTQNDIDVYVKDKKNLKFDKILRNVITHPSDKTDLELAFLANCNSYILNRILKEYSSLQIDNPEITQLPYRLVQLKEHFVAAELSPIRGFNSFLQFLKSNPITLGTETEVVYTLGSRLASRLVEFQTGDKYEKIRISYSDSLKLIQDILMKLKEDISEIGYEFIMPFMRALNNDLRKGFADLEKKVNPQIEIEILEANVILDNEENDPESNSKSVDVKFIIRSSRNSARDIAIHRVSARGDDLLEGNDLSFDTQLSAGEEIMKSITLEIKDEVIQQDVAQVEFDVDYEDFYTYNDSSDTLRWPTLPKTINLKKSCFRELDNKYKGSSGGSELEWDNPMFYGRDSIINEIEKEVLASWNSQIAIYGQKRSGKSSLLNRLKYRLEQNPDLVCIKFNLQGSDNENEDDPFKPDNDKFVKWMLRRIAKKLCREKKLRRYVNKEWIDDCFSQNNDPFEAFEEFMLRIREIEEIARYHIVVMIDEFTYLYQLIKTGVVNQNFMRRWKALIESPGVSLQSIVAGQDTLPVFMKESYAANSFAIFNLKLLTYLTKEEALKLITDPVKELRFHARSEELIYDYTAGSAFFTQIVCSRLIDYLNEKKKASIVTKEEVEEVIEILSAKLEKKEATIFECLMNEADGSNFNNEDNELILKALAVKTRGGGSCKAEDLEVNIPMERVIPVLDHLFSRRVISKDEFGGYFINVNLFKRWILNQ